VLQGSLNAEVHPGVGEGEGEGDGDPPTKAAHLPVKVPDEAWNRTFVMEVLQPLE